MSSSTEVGKTATLFRGMTVGAKLASIFLHMKGHFFLKGVLQPLIAHMQNASSIEVHTHTAITCARTSSSWPCTGTFHR